MGSEGKVLDWALRPDLIVNSHLNSDPVLFHVCASVSMSTFEMFFKIYSN